MHKIYDEKTGVQPIIVVHLSGEECTLNLKCFSWDGMACFRFNNVGDLLSIFLNQSYYPELITLNTLKKVGIKTEFAAKEQPWHIWLDSWNHERIERVIRKVYRSNSDAVNSLPPSQRFHIYLNYSTDLYEIKYSEQHYSELAATMMQNKNINFPILSVAGEISKKKRIHYKQAQYEAACQVAGETGIQLPRGVQYWFEEPNELVLWMLQYVIEGNKHIKRCEFCGRYFVPERSTKKYCSDKCGNKARRATSFCGEMELRSLYTSIISNLSGKIKRKSENGREYATDFYDQESIDPKTVRQKFLSDNDAYRRDLIDAYNTKKASPTLENEEEYNLMKGAYKDWLEDQYKYVTSLRMKKR